MIFGNGTAEYGAGDNCKRTLRTDDKILKAVPRAAYNFSAEFSISPVEARP